MSYSNKMNLDEFFAALENEVYAIAKLDADFPNYFPYSDIDILCCDMGAVSKCILKVANRYVEQGFTVRAESDAVSGKAKIDIYSPDDSERLDFRFDLITRLPEYKKVRIKPHYLFSILEGRTGITRQYDGHSYTLYVPSAVDDLVLRYLEYIEWYEIRPDKVKHLEYILDKISTEPESRAFIDKLHLYTELLPLEIPAGSHFEAVTIRGSVAAAPEPALAGVKPPDEQPAAVTGESPACTVEGRSGEPGPPEETERDTRKAAASGAPSGFAATMKILFKDILKRQ